MKKVLIGLSLLVNIVCAKQVEDKAYFVSATDDETIVVEQIQFENNNRPFVPRELVPIDLSNKTIIPSKKVHINKISQYSRHYTNNQQELKREYIQVASLMEKFSIKKVIRELKAKNYQVRTIKEDKSVKILVGPYTSKNMYRELNRVKYLYSDAFIKKL